MLSINKDTSTKKVVFVNRVNRQLLIYLEHICAIRFITKYLPIVEPPAECENFVWSQTFISL